MKLEVIWILTNMAYYASEDHINLIAETIIEPLSKNIEVILQKDVQNLKLLTQINYFI
jgi:hypothetical protein